MIEKSKEQKFDVLIAMGFKPKRVYDSRWKDNRNYWWLKFLNGDHMSVCISDGTDGGYFGNPGWEKNEIQIDAIRSVLRREGIIFDSNANKTHSITEENREEEPI